MTQHALPDIDHAPFHGLKLNPALDLAGLAARFAEDGGRLQIADVLVPESAGLVHEVLARRTPWGLAWYDGRPQFRRGEEVRALSDRELAALNAQIMTAARERYQYVYNCYPMLRAFQEGWLPEHPLMRFLEFINTDPVTDLIRAVTGWRGALKADAQATCYRPNHFLSRHDDRGDDEPRRFAHVFGFSKLWRPDWGGYLQFFNAAGDVERALMPRYNVLSLFAVPRDHSVGQVAPFAGAPRLSITGWFRDR